MTWNVCQSWSRVTKPKLQYIERYMYCVTYNTHCHVIHACYFLKIYIHIDISYVWFYIYCLYLFYIISYSYGKRNSKLVSFSKLHCFYLQIQWNTIEARCQKGQIFVKNFYFYEQSGLIFVLYNGYAKLKWYVYVHFLITITIVLFKLRSSSETYQIFEKNR